MRLLRLCSALLVVLVTAGCDPAMCPTGTIAMGGRCVDPPDASASDAALPDDAGGETRDGAQGDAGVSGPIQAVALREGAAAVGVSVVFHDADGNVLESGLTDVAGTSTSTVAGVAGVTVIDQRRRGTEIHSVMGVVPNETITFDLRGDSGERLVEVLLPGALTDAAEYEVFSPCNDDRDADHSRPFVACGVEGMRVPVLALALGHGGILGYGSAVAETAETATAIAGWNTSFIDVALDVSWGTLTDGIVDVRTVPEHVGAPSLVISSYREEPQRLTTIRDIPFPLVIVASASDADNVVLSIAEATSSSTIGTSGFAANLSSAPTIDTFEADRSDPQSPELRWTGSMSGAGTEAAAEFVYERAGAPVVWTIHAAPSVRSVRVPRLPDAHAGLRVTPEVPAYSLSWHDGGAGLTWAAVRSHPLLPWTERTTRLSSATVSGTF